MREARVYQGRGKGLARYLLKRGMQAAGARPRNPGAASCAAQLEWMEVYMRSILLWLVGVPIPIIILIALLT